MSMKEFRERRMRALTDGADIAKQFRAELSDGGVTELYFYDAIDSWGGYWGISAKDMIEALAGAGDVLIHMNSPGGEAIEALAIYATMRQHPGTITVRIEGMAASAASVVMLGASNVVIEPNAMVMIHDAWGIELGNADALRKYADMLDKVSQNIATIYSAKGTATDADGWRAAMKEETWYVGQEAVDAGLVDTVVQPMQADGDGEVIGADEDEGIEYFAARWDRKTVAAMYGAQSSRLHRSGREASPVETAVEAGDDTHAGTVGIPDFEAFRAALGGLKTA